MVRCLITLALVVQATPVLAQENCGSSSLTREQLSVFVIMKQRGDEIPITDFVRFTSRNIDGTLEIGVPYTVDTKDVLSPYMLFIETLPKLPIERKSPERIKWQFNGGDWFTFPYRYIYPNQLGNFSYKIAQSASPALSFRTEWLDNLRLGGSFAVVRLLENGQEVPMGSVEYPTAKVIADVFNEARNQALTGLKPCKPAVFITPRN